MQYGGKCELILDFMYTGSMMLLLVHILSLLISTMHFQSGSMLILAHLVSMSCRSAHITAKPKGNEREKERLCVCVIRFDIFTHFNLNGYGYRS